jgi:hypothetical protein
MQLSTFPTFLAFLTQALCFPAPASNPWQRLDIPPPFAASALDRRPWGPRPAT